MLLEAQPSPPRLTPMLSHAQDFQKSRRAPRAMAKPEQLKYQTNRVAEEGAKPAEEHGAFDSKATTYAPNLTSFLQEPDTHEHSQIKADIRACKGELHWALKADLRSCKGDHSQIKAVLEKYFNPAAKTRRQREVFEDGAKPAEDKRRGPRSEGNDKEGNDTKPAEDSSSSDKYRITLINLSLIDNYFNPAVEIGTKSVRRKINESLESETKA